MSDPRSEDTPREARERRERLAERDREEAAIRADSVNDCTGCGAIFATPVEVIDHARAGCAS